MSRFQILSLSGGGIRGLYSIKVLALLEEQLAANNSDPTYNIAKHFDLITGTSIGGILALGLASGMNARQLLEVIDKNRTKIFDNPRKWRWPLIGKFFHTCHRAFKSLHDQSALKEVLNGQFGNKVIQDLERPVVIPSINGNTGEPKFFKTPHHISFTFDKNVRLVDVALATSAAPTYFDPVNVVDSLMIDGGLVANAPTLVGIHEAIHFLNVPQESVYLLNIGTLSEKITLNSDRNKKRWGYLKAWGFGSTLIELTMSANSTMHNHIAKHMLKDRLLTLDDPNTKNQSTSLTLDNSSDEAAAMLRGKAYEKVKSEINSKQLKDFFTHTPSKLHYSGLEA